MTDNKRFRVIVLCKKKKSVEGDTTGSTTVKDAHPLFSTAERVGKVAFDWTTKTPLVEITYRNANLVHLDNIQKGSFELRHKKWIVRPLGCMRTKRKGPPSFDIFYSIYVPRYEDNFRNVCLKENLPKGLLETYSRVNNLAHIALDLFSAHMVHSQCRPEHTLVDAHGNLFLTDQKFLVPKKYYTHEAVQGNIGFKKDLFLAPEIHHIYLKKKEFSDILPLYPFSNDMWGLGMQALLFLVHQNGRDDLIQQFNKTLQATELSEYEKIFSSVFSRLQITIYLNDEYSFEECMHYHALLDVVREMVRPEVEQRISATHLVERLRQLAAIINNPLLNRALSIGMTYSTVKRIDDYVTSHIDVLKARLDSGVEKNLYLHKNDTGLLRSMDILYEGLPNEPQKVGEDGKPIVRVLVKTELVGHGSYCNAYETTDWLKGKEFVKLILRRETHKNTSNAVMMERMMGVWKAVRNKKGIVPLPFILSDFLEYSVKDKVEKRFFYVMQKYPDTLIDCSKPRKRAYLSSSCCEDDRHCRRVSEPQRSKYHPY